MHTYLHSAFSDLGEYPSSDELGQLYQRYDINQDGILDFEEFTLMALDLTIKRYDGLGVTKVCTNVYACTP